MQHSIARWWPLAGVLLCATVSAADEAAIAQCAAVDNPTARLACYDAAAGRAATPADAAAVPAPAPAAAPAVAEFGRDSPVKSISAHIAGRLTEWEKGTLIRLDNGQVWKVMEDKSAIYPGLQENPEVEITRGMFGYTMEIKPIRRKFPVLRVS